MSSMAGPVEALVARARRESTACAEVERTVSAASKVSLGKQWCFEVPRERERKRVRGKE